MFVELKTAQQNTLAQHTDISMKMNTMLIEMEYEDNIDDGMSHNDSIKSIAREWGMSHEEVNNIIQPFLKKLDDIDHTNDLGDII